MNHFKLLQEETTFFNENGNVMKNKQDFKTSNVNAVFLAVDTGDKNDCSIIILDKKYDFELVFQTTNNATKEQLEYYFNNNKNMIIEKLHDFQKEIKS